jgi:hypothetical protein
MIVPNPANPQSLNRYSYCYNNPLKYIDPSGNEVDIYGVDVNYLDNMNSMQQASFWEYMGGGAADLIPLWNAYDTLRSIDQYYSNKLEESQIKFNIVASYLGTLISVSGKYSYVGGHVLQNHIIEFNLSNVKIGNIDTFVPILAHELIHAFGQSIDITDSFPDFTQYEEAIAYRYQYIISRNTGTDPGDLCWSCFYAANLDQPTLKLIFAGTAYEGAPTFPNNAGQTELTVDASNYMIALSQHANDWRKEALSFS